MPYIISFWSCSGMMQMQKKKSLSVKLLVLSDRIRHRATWESAERSLHWVSGKFPSWLKKYQAACFVDESITAQGPLAEGHTLSQYKTLSQYVIQSDCEKKKITETQRISVYRLQHDCCSFGDFTWKTEPEQLNFHSSVPVWGRWVQQVV